MAYEAKAGTKTVKGWVLAIEWDEDDMPTAVVIQTEDGTEYLIEETDQAEGLLELEDAQVEVTGEVDDSDPDGPTLTVSAFEVVEEAAEWDDEEDEDDDEKDLPPDVEDLSDDEEDGEDDWEEEGDEDDEYEEGDEDEEDDEYVDDEDDDDE